LKRKDIDENNLVSDLIQNGIDYLESKIYDKAIEMFKKALDYEPNNTKAWFYLGTTFQKLDNPEKQIEESREEADRAKAIAHLLASMYFLFDNQYKAIDCFEKVVSIDPTNHEAWYELGFEYWAITKYKKSDECYKKAAELDPGNVKYISKLAGKYLEEKDEEKLSEVCKKGIEIASKQLSENPQDFYKLNDLGFLYYCEKNYGKALEYFGKASKIKPDEAPLWYLIGLMHRELKNYDEAIKNFKKALEIDPEYKNAKADLDEVIDELKNQKYNLNRNYTNKSM